MLEEIFKFCENDQIWICTYACNFAAALKPKIGTMDVAISLGAISSHVSNFTHTSNKSPIYLQFYITRHDTTPKYVANGVWTRNSFIVAILNARRNQGNSNTKQNLVTLDNSFAERGQECITCHEKNLVYLNGLSGHKFHVIHSPVQWLNNLAGITEVKKSSTESFVLVIIWTVIQQTNIV